LQEKMGKSVVSAETLFICTHIYAICSSKCTFFWRACFLENA